MGRLARIVALASIGAFAFSAGNILNPELAYAGPKQPVKAKPDPNEVKNLKRAIETEIKVSGLNDPKKLYHFSGAGQKENGENKWRVAYEAANPNLVAVIFHAHMGLLQRGYYDDVIIASAHLLKSLEFYQVRHAPHSLNNIRETLQGDQNGRSFSFLDGTKGQELARNPIEFSGLENGKALQLYSNMQELARFIGSKWQTNFNLAEAENEIARLYAKIGAENLPEYDRKIWEKSNGLEYREFMSGLKLRMHEAEKQRMSDAAKIAADGFKKYRGQEQLVRGIVWDPLYTEVLSRELAKAGVSRIVVTSGVTDYFTWNRRQNNPFLRKPELVK